MVSKTLLKGKPATEHREAILDAARALLQRNGYKRMTVDDVAREANLGKGTIYLYFQSKEDVALSVIDRSNERLRGRLREILRGTERPVVRLRQMLMERVLFRFDTAQGYTKGLDDLLEALRAPLRERRARYREAEARILAEILVEGRTRGVFALEDPFNLADALLTATDSLLPYTKSCRELGDRGEVERRTSDLVDLLVRAVSTGPETQEPVTLDDHLKNLVKDK